MRSLKILKIRRILRFFSNIFNSSKYLLWLFMSVYYYYSKLFSLNSIVWVAYFIHFIKFLNKFRWAFNLMHTNKFLTQFKELICVKIFFVAPRESIQWLRNFLISNQHLLYLFDSHHLSVDILKLLMF